MKWFALLLCLTAQAGFAAEQESAAEILTAAATQGGLVVQLGCGDGRLTAALHANDSFLVQGLDVNAKNIATARAHIQSLGLYGKVSIEQFDGQRLPYADNLVNLIVTGDECLVPEAELLRVLAPNGLVLAQHTAHITLRKPWPKEIDEWTHWLHDAGNTAVAHDTRVGPPQRMQWVVDPLWSRGHEIITSVGAVVTARGRIMYVVDEGLPGVYSMPSKWVVVARNAFNGVLLWKHPVPEWDPPIVKGGHTGGFKPRRFATDGERLFLPTGGNAVLTALDAATGQSLKTLESAGDTTDILCQDGLVVARTAPDRNKKNPAMLIAARANTLDVIWKVATPALVTPTLALGAGHVYFDGGKALMALDLKTGKEVWHLALKQSAKIEISGKSSEILVEHDGKVFFQGSSGLMALAADSGKVLWEEKGSARGKRSGFFVADGLIWRFHDPNVIGIDAVSGIPRKYIDASPVFSEGHHLRCYPPKATDEFLITQNRGAEFVGLTSPRLTQNDWLRGNCGHGVMPANGLLYAPPNQCFCYAGAMLTGFKALAAGPVPPPADPLKDPMRLEHGDVFAEVQMQDSTIQKPSDWPMYRHDAARLGTTPDTVGGEIHEVWKTALGGRLTQPVAVGGMLVVAASEAHTVHALDAKDGKKLWNFIAGGRIDSSPTIHEDLVLFGCTDGCVYCLRATDGKLVWRFRAAPEQRLIGAFGQLESAWPVHGSVLVLDGVAYFTAGRSTYLDGGVFAFGLDPRSGCIVHYKQLEGGVPDGTVPTAAKTDPPFVPAFHVEGARSDLLVSDGVSVFMGPLKFDTKLARQPTPYIASGSVKTVALDLSNAPYVDTSIMRAGLEKKHGSEFASLGVLRGPMGDKRMGLHLLATGGFLDDTYYNRNYWMYAANWPGFYIANLSAKAGELLVVDGTTTYGVQAYTSRSIHSPTFTPATKGYLLFADDNRSEPVLDDRTRGRDKGIGYTRAVPPKWFQWMPVRIRAMVKAGDTLFVAGPPDVMDEKDPYAAFENRKGAQLVALSASDGKKLAERSLTAPPVFDGMIAAGGRLLVALTDGSVVCLTGETSVNHAAANTAR